jgi:hypothetical protein
MTDKKWKYKKVNEHQKFLPDNFGPIAYLLCEQLVGQSDADIKVCEEAAIVEVDAPSGRNSMYCKAHANERLLGLPSMFSQATT